MRKPRRCANGHEALNPNQAQVEVKVGPPTPVPRSHLRCVNGNVPAAGNLGPLPVQRAHNGHYPLAHLARHIDVDTPVLFCYAL